MARGDIRQRAKGSWSLTVELERDPTTGARRQKSETVVGTKKQADARLSALLLEVRGGQVGNAGAMTVGQFLTRWLTEHARPNLAPKTWSGYRAKIDNQISPVLGRRRLETLRPAHVLAWKGELRAMRRRGSDRPIAPATQRLAFRILHSALATAVAWRLIATNPAAAIPGPVGASPEMTVWSADQASAVLASARERDRFWHAFFAVALNTGMRLAELVGLRWTDLDLERGTLRVVQTIAWVDKITPAGRGGWVTKPPKTNAGRRVIPIGPDLVAVLRRHWMTQEVQRAACGASWVDRGLVFPSSLGTPIQSYRVRDTLGKIAGAAGVPVVRVHDLRHTAATLMLSAGVNVKVVSERLGHASVAITMATYSHVLPGMQEEATTVLEGLLRAVPKGELLGGSAAVGFAAE